MTISNDATRWSSPVKRLHAWFMARSQGRYESLVGERKRALLGGLSGDVVEIGAGTGPNLKFYSPDVRLTVIEPNIHMHKYLLEEAHRLGIGVRIQAGVAEATNLPDECTDAVVATLVLCSVTDVQAVLCEVQRILRPGGGFVFMEHVAEPHGTFRRRVQTLIKPVWRLIADGCTPDRETRREIAGAGLVFTEFHNFRLQLPIIGPHISGCAMKPSRAKITS